MTDKQINILKDKTRYLLEFKRGHQYLLVFDRASGLTRENIKVLNKALEKEFKVKVIGLLLNGIDNMRVLTLEEKNEN